MAVRAALILQFKCAGCGTEASKCGGLVGHKRSVLTVELRPASVHVLEGTGGVGQGGGRQGGRMEI